MLRLNASEDNMPHPLLIAAVGGVALSLLISTINYIGGMKNTQYLVYTASALTWAGIMLWLYHKRNEAWLDHYEPARTAVVGGGLIAIVGYALVAAFIPGLPSLILMLHAVGIGLLKGTLFALATATVITVLRIAWLISCDYKLRRDHRYVRFRMA